MVIPSVNVPYVKKGDNIGVALDLTVPIITFFFNGMKIPGYFRNFNLNGMFFPVISSSAKIRLVFKRTLKKKLFIFFSAQHFPT